MHLVAWLALTAVIASVVTSLALLEVNILNNKVLVGDPLEPSQASLFFLDSSYVDTEALTGEQRLTVFYRLLAFIILIQIPISFVADSFGVVYYQIWISQRINQHLRVTMIENAEHLSLRYHSHARTGEAIYRVYQDSAMITEVIASWILDPIEQGTMVFFSLFVVFLFSPVLGFVCILAIVPVVCFMAWYTPHFQHDSRIARESSSDLTSRIQEVAAAIRVMKANQAEATASERFDQDSHAALDRAYELRRGMVLMGILMAFIVGIAILVVDYLMANWTVREESTWRAGVFALVGFVVWNFGAFQGARERTGTVLGTSRWLFTSLWLRCQDMAIGLDRAFYLLELEPEVVDAENPANMPAPIRYVTYDNVYFCYETGKSILQGVTLEARAGTITAIVGATGSGKSTLTSMLLRLYDPDEGSVAINGVDLKGIRMGDLRGNVAIALQQNVLFASTVAENIGYAAENASREAVEAAAKIACAHDFIEDMEYGYDTELGERGAKLSTGERQRLTIARAILRDTPVLILDEPTAALDAQTEHEVLERLAEWGRERVLFLITHRLSTIRNADQIAFLEDGRIVEVGVHDTLMAIPNGRYRDFVTAETEGADSGGETAP
jgi:ABC-type multidrug transport system fused ATPase/permease subunit